jgi:hypothetical protein
MAAAVDAAEERKALDTKIREVEKELKEATGERELALQQRLTALEQQKLLLMQQQSAAAGGAAAADIINAAAARAAAEVAEQFTKLHAGGQQQLVDEVRSWNSSRTVEASKLSLSDLLVLRRLLRMYVVPEGAEVSAVLDPSACDNDFEWDNTPEPGQRQSYLATIQANLPSSLFSKLALKSQVRVDLKVKGLGCRIVAKSDELLIGRRWGNIPEAGCVIGIELKKKLTQSGVT